MADRGRPLRLGTRGSKLALAQSGLVAASLERLGHAVERVVIRTSGDRLADASLAKVGGKGLFLKELEEALERGEIDFAVHSMKDVPAELPAGFEIAAVPLREDVRDVIILGESLRARAPAGNDAPRATPGDGERAIAALPLAAAVGTGSLRRRSQILARRADLRVEPMRGNVDTRLEKAARGETSAIVLAYAGLRRLGLDVPVAVLDALQFLPAPGQGALALEIRAGDGELAQALAPLHDEPTSQACTAERAFLRRLGASCQVPVAAFARTARGEELTIDGLVASLDGRTIMRDGLSGPAEQAETLGARLADGLLARGAADVLAGAAREAGSL